MTFIHQDQSRATNGWPVVGKHIGLLVDDGLEELRDKVQEFNNRWGQKALNFSKLAGSI